MNPEEIEQMKRDREAGTDGPWRLSGLLMQGQSGDVCLMGEPAQYAGDKSRMLDNWEVNARRIARVPDLEAKVLRLREALEWHPIETVPIGEAVIVTDAPDGIVKWAVAEREADGGILISAPGIPVTSSKWWTHWMPIPMPPDEPSENGAT